MEPSIKTLEPGYLGRWCVNAVKQMASDPLAAIYIVLIISVFTLSGTVSKYGTANFVAFAFLVFVPLFYRTLCVATVDDSKVSSAVWKSLVASVTGIFSMNYTLELIVYGSVVVALWLIGLDFSGMNYMTSTVIYFSYDMASGLLCVTPLSAVSTTISGTVYWKFMQKNPKIWKIMFPFTIGFVLSMLIVDILTHGIGVLLYPVFVLFFIREAFLEIINGPRKPKVAIVAPTRYAEGAI